MGTDQMHYPDSGQKEPIVEGSLEQEEAKDLPDDKTETDPGEQNNDQKEIEELTALSRKQFKTGMIMMVSSLAVTLICALLESYMNAHYQTNPIGPQLQFVVKASSYLFYFGLFFIVRYYITRRKIPRG